MEIITSFFSTTPMAIFLVPVILILIVLLVILNKSHKVEVIAEVAVPPVTTIPAKADGTEVVSQVIPSVTIPTPPASPSVETVVQSAIVTPIAETVAIKEDTVVPLPAPVLTPLETVPAPTPAVVPSLRPVEPASVVVEAVEVSPVQTEVISPAETHALSEITQSMPEVAEVISPQAIITEVNEASSLSEVQTQSITEEVQQSPVAHPSI